MNRLLLICAAAASLCFAVALPLQAASSGNSSTSNLAPQVTNMTREQLLAYHVKLEHDLDGKSFTHIKDRDREAISAAQAHIRGLLNKVTTLEALDEEQRLTLFNEHDRIAALIESRAGDRLICDRVYKTGTHRPTIECTTVAERARASHAVETLQRQSQLQGNPIPSR